MKEQMIADRRIRAFGARLVVFLGMLYVVSVGASFGFGLQYFVRYENDVPAMTIALVFNLILALTIILTGISLANRKKGVLPIALCVVVAIVAATYFVSLPVEAFGKYPDSVEKSAVIAFIVLFFLHGLHTLCLSLKWKKVKIVISCILAIATVVCSFGAYISEDLLGIAMGFYATHIGLAFAFLLCAVGQFENIRVNTEVCKRPVGKTAKIIILIVTVAATLIMIPISLDLNDGTLIDVTQKTQNEDLYGHDNYDAIAIAEKAVKTQLKSPSTAKFCKTSEYAVKNSGNTWTVEGWVEAQNSFGATLRNSFTVSFTFNSSNQYTINYCNIN